MLRLSKLNWFRAIMVIAVFAALAGIAIADTVTITGEVNDNYQIVANGQIYEIADTPEGNEWCKRRKTSKLLPLSAMRC